MIFTTRSNCTSLFILLIAFSALSFFCAGETKNILETDSPTTELRAQKPKAAKAKTLLHGQIDMLSYAYRESGIVLSSIPSSVTIEKVLVGSPAYYANIQTRDRIVSAHFKYDKLCLSINRAGTPYYTEIRLASASNQSETPRMGQMRAIGFRYFMGSGEVTYIDPNSDLFGKVHVGDTYMYLAKRNNTSTSTLYPVFKQNGILRSYPCQQKSIDYFSAAMAQKFRQDGFGAPPHPPH